MKPKKKKKRTKVHPNVVQRPQRHRPNRQTHYYSYASESCTSPRAGSTFSKLFCPCISSYCPLSDPFFRTTTDLPPREFPSMCAPSNPKRLAILPCFIADSTWSAVRASANVSLYLEMRLLDTSSCSRASRKWITGLVERGGKGGGEIWDLTRLELQK